MDKKSLVIKSKQFENEEKINNELKSKIEALNKEKIKLQNENSQVNNKLLSVIKVLNDEKIKIQNENAQVNNELKSEIILLNNEKTRIQSENTQLCDRNEHLSKEIDNYREYIKNPPGSFPKIATAVSDYINAQCDNLSDYFINKPNPSRKSAQIVRELKEYYSKTIKAQKMAEYKLEYLLSIYPKLEEVLDADYKDIREDLPDYDSEVDPIKDYLSKEEWLCLSESERNQRALDNYINKRTKSKWQIGRDYELYIGYIYQNKGYDVDYIGSYAKFEDLGRDLICKKDGITLIIQCKYWSKEKQIHENHINQLYGTTLAYAITNDLPIESVKSLLVTNTTLSPMAKEFAKILNVNYKENSEIGDFPRIKCNVNYDEFGIRTKIYHLPMDQQYDRVQIKNKDEFFAFTVEEAENAGFRRAFKYSGIRKW